MRPQILTVSAIRLMLCAKSLQSCLTLWDSMDCSPPDSSVYGILQARILEYAHLQGMFPTQGSNQCHLQLLHCKWILYHWATREIPSLWHLYKNYFNFFYFWSCYMACGILVPHSGIKPVPPALEAWSLNHWITRKAPNLWYFVIVAMTN